MVSPASNIFSPNPLCSPLDYYDWLSLRHLKNLELFHHGKEKIHEKDDHSLYMPENLSCSWGINYSYSETSQGKTSTACCLCVLLFWFNKDFSPVIFRASVKHGIHSLSLCSGLCPPLGLILLHSSPSHSRLIGLLF